MRVAYVYEEARDNGEVLGCDGASFASADAAIEFFNQLDTVLSKKIAIEKETNVCVDSGDLLERQ